jgi:hypothetical protein
MYVAAVSVARARLTDCDLGTASVFSRRSVLGLDSLFRIEVFCLLGGDFPPGVPRARSLPGRLRATALAAANWAHIHPRLGCLDGIARRSRRRLDFGFCVLSPLGCALACVLVLVTAPGLRSGCGSSTSQGTNAMLSWDRRFHWVIYWIPLAERWSSRVCY